VNTDENLADLLTKPLSGPKQAKFVRMVLHHVFPEKGNGDMGADEVVLATPKNWNYLPFCTHGVSFKF